MDPTILDEDRKSLVANDIREREAFMKYLTSLDPNTDEESYFVQDGIEGEIPQWLEGSFFRSGPAKFEINGVRVHVVDGDGMLVKLSFGFDESNKTTSAPSFLKISQVAIPIVPSPPVITTTLP